MAPEAKSLGLAVDMVMLWKLPVVVTLVVIAAECGSLQAAMLCGEGFVSSGTCHPGVCQVAHMELLLCKGI